MPGTLTDADVGKTVVTESGEEVGEITTVRNNVAAVEPDPNSDLTDEFKRMLGWSDGSDEETYRLQEEYVSSTSRDTVVVFDEHDMDVDTDTP